MRISLALFVALFLAATGSGQVAGVKKVDPKKVEPAPLDAEKVNGKTIDQYIKEFSSKDTSRREQAIRTIAAFPPDTAIRAIPALLAELKRHAGSVSVDLSVRTAICVVLAEIFRSSDKIDTKLKTEAAGIVGRFLQDSQIVMKYRAVQTIGTIGPEAIKATPLLLAMLRDQSSWEIRQAAALALAGIAHDPKTGVDLNVLKALYATLNDSAFQVRLAAIQALAYLGPPSDDGLKRSYIESLKPIAIKDPEPSLQIWARVAIAYAANQFDQEVLGPIAKMMSDPDPAIRVQAVQSMGAIGPKAASVTLKSIIARFEDKDASVKLMAIWAAGQMGGDAKIMALQPLEKIAADPKEPEQIKKLAKDSIEKLKGNAK
jgi:HEAT repeat protein